MMSRILLYSYLYTSQSLLVVSDVSAVSDEPQEGSGCKSVIGVEIEGAV